MTGKFRLLAPTLGIVTATRLATTIPAGAIIKVSSVPVDGLVDVNWEGKEMMVFVDDLKHRSEKIGQTSTLPPS